MQQRKRRRLGWGWLRACLSSVSLGLLFFLCVHLQREAERPMVASSASPQESTADFPARIERVTDALTTLAWALPTPTTERQGAGQLRWLHRRYDITIPAPQDPQAIERMLDPIRTAAPGVTVRVIPAAAGTQVQIGVDGLLTHTLAVHWLGRRPRAAIIVDDLGNDLLTARALARVEPPLTLAVMPFRPFSKEVAELAAVLGREVLLHLPMEAESGEEFGAAGVLHATAEQSEVVRLLDASFASVPHVAGVNNHLGSRFTADRERMRWVLEQLKERNLFFVDSLTTPHSVACEVAAAIALPCVARNVFLDDTDDEASIRSQVDRIVAVAQTRGDVVAIGHARPATIAVLQSALPGFAAAGVDVVPVATLLADASAPPPGT